MSFGAPHGFHKSRCRQILGKTQELQDSPACNFMLRSFKRNEAAAEPERVNPGKHRAVCVRAALLLVCLVVTSATLNTAERTQHGKPEQGSSPPGVHRAQQGRARWGSAALQLPLMVGVEGSMGSLRATFLPQLLWAHLLLAKPVRVCSAPPRLFLCQGLRCCLRI